MLKVYKPLVCVTLLWLEPLYWTAIPYRYNRIQNLCLVAEVPVESRQEI